MLAAYRSNPYRYIRARTIKKTREREGPARVGTSENEEMLPGSEPSRGQQPGSSPLEDGAEVWPDQERRSR
jgi:hypothetical protein